MKKNKSGFTLIELLVVIAIIGLLSTLSVLALNTARARSRDAKRVSDVKQIQTALEMYFNDNNAYPASLTTGAAFISTTSSSTLIAIVPAPPTPSNDGTCKTPDPAYTYTVDSGNSTYTIKFCLGTATGGLPAGGNIATPGGISNGTYTP